MSNYDIKFPVGYHRFHKNQLFNFQLNRWYSLGFMPFDDIKNIGENINTFGDWKNKMVKLAEKAILQNRLMNAAFYYRAAEFYTMDGDSLDKNYYYDKFIKLFYEAIQEDKVEKIKVPYESIYLPVIKLTPVNEKKGTIILHGGFDSFLEEWYLIMKYFEYKGYEVIGFEGPGQGNVLLKQGFALDYQWERPVKAILDYFNLDNVSLFGFSMGGWFCLRAAAYESRIKNVIASGHAIDYMKIPPAFAQWLMNFFIKNFRSYSAKSFSKMIKKGGMQAWQINNLIHITKIKTPIEAYEYAMQLNEQNLHSELIRQNVLLLTGENDHFIPFKMHNMQIKALINAKSFTGRVFTKEEHADNHCQIGNIKLMLDFIIDWLKDK